MSGVTEEKAAWVGRVLGVQAGAGGGSAVSLAAAAEAWQSAIETVDGQIGALQSALRGSDDEELQEIGEYGLNAITGGHKVRLMAALLGAQKGNAGDLGKLPTLAAGFREHLESDERVEACDDNPFGVAVSVRATLGPALDLLARVSG